MIHPLSFNLSFYTLISYYFASGDVWGRKRKETNVNLSSEHRYIISINRAILPKLLPLIIWQLNSFYVHVLRASLYHFYKPGKVTKINFPFLFVNFPKLSLSKHVLLGHWIVGHRYTKYINRPWLPPAK